MQEEFENNPGRQWLNRIILDIHSQKKGDDLVIDNRLNLVDSFRYFHPDQRDAYTCWNTQIGARSTNYGSRIDYILVNKELLVNMIDSVILSDVMGSDHCPVLAHFQLEIIPAARLPSLCSKFYPEFSGTQTLLSSFWSQGETSSEKSTDRKRKMVEEPKKGKKTVQMKMSSFCQKRHEEPKDKIPDVFEDAEVSVQGAEPNREAAAAWKSVLKGPQPAPLCSGHNEPCVERVVKKNGPNRNRRFWVCARGEGRTNDPNARCNYFKWASTT